MSERGVGHDAAHTVREFNPQIMWKDDRSVDHGAEFRCRLLGKLLDFRRVPGRVLAMYFVGLEIGEPTKLYT